MTRVDAQPLAGVASQVLVGEEEHAVAALEGPAQDGGRVRRGADGAAVAAHEGLQRGGRVHVGDGDRALGVDDAREFVPGGVDVLGLGHVGHRAAGGEVGQHDGLIGPCEDVGALGHEVHPAEQDEVGLGPVGGLARQLEGVAADVGEADHVVALVVVAEDQQALAEGGADAADAIAQLVGRHRQVALGDLRLPGDAMRLLGERHRGDVALAVGVGQILGQARCDVVAGDDLRGAAEAWCGHDRTPIQRARRRPGGAGPIHFVSF